MKLLWQCWHVGAESSWQKKSYLNVDGGRTRSKVRMTNVCGEERDWDTKVDLKEIYVVEHRRR